MNSIDSVLGQRVTYPQRYSPDVLVAVPRQLNRKSLAVHDDALPFAGADAWHAYEVSCLTGSGLPTAGVMKMVVPCSSPSIVESKSLKLYLNSFNMEPMGATRAEATRAMEARVRQDLSTLLCADVKVKIFGMAATEAHLGEMSGYETLEESVGDIDIEHYTEQPDLLGEGEETDGLSVKSHLLRSNCRVTHQPDWGTIFIKMGRGLTPKRADLLRYIVSLRGENHFHEEICELAFKRIMDKFAPSRLMVTCMYTRRGGIDINPVRATSGDLADAAALLNVEQLTATPLRN